MEENRQDQEPRRDPMADLEARINAAIEEARPKLRRAIEELEARVDAAVTEVRPRVESAVDEVKPRVDRLIRDVQPRLDTVLRRIQEGIAEFRQDLEKRASRPADVTPKGTLPRNSEAEGTGPTDAAGADDTPPTP